tara:strand:+ start:361 stop:591 length:231 start_codon:yes stop_codon:yes gene_type:complete
MGNTMLFFPMSKDKKRLNWRTAKELSIGDDIMYQGKRHVLYQKYPVGTALENICIKIKDIELNHVQTVRITDCHLM